MFITPTAPNVRLALPSIVALSVNSNRHPSLPNVMEMKLVATTSAHAGCFPLRTNSFIRRRARAYANVPGTIKRLQSFRPQPSISSRPCYTKSQTNAQQDSIPGYCFWAIMRLWTSLPCASSQVVVWSTAFSLAFSIMGRPKFRNRVWEYETYLKL